MKTGRTEQKIEAKKESHQEIKLGRKRKFEEEEANKISESPRMTRQRIDC